jgi:hypothetical protein
MKLGSIAVTTLLLGFALDLAGCNLSNTGTTATYDKCYRALKAQNLEDNAAKISCINSNQVKVTRGLTGQTAGPQLDYYLNFYGSVTNNTTDLVITSFRIAISLPNGKQSSKLFEGRFIQPGQLEDFTFYANDLIGLELSDFKKGPNDKPLWTWFVEPLTGLTISAY